MIEIENFLSQDICDYSINYFRRNKKHLLKFNKRKKIHLQDEKKDPVISNLITRYSKIYPNYYLKKHRINLLAYRRTPLIGMMTLFIMIKPLLLI